MQIKVKERGTNTHIRFLSNSHKTKVILDEEQKAELFRELADTYSAGDAIGSDHPFHDLSPSELVEQLEEVDGFE